MYHIKLTALVLLLMVCSSCTLSYSLKDRSFDVEQYDKSDWDELSRDIQNDKDKNYDFQDTRWETDPEFNQELRFFRMDRENLD